MIRKLNNQQIKRQLLTKGYVLIDMLNLIKENIQITAINTSLVQQIKNFIFY